VAGLVTAAERLTASFRDPSGHVFRLGDRILRTVLETGAADYEFVRATGLLERLVENGWVISAEEIDPALVGTTAGAVRYLLQHPRLPFLSHPYEWSFGALRAAAERQLDIHLAALECGVTLADASAYNLQFVGSAPLFIDYLSFRRYEPGSYWAGYRQFCEQFLNPLLLQACCGVPFQPWYRGALEGIRALDLLPLLPLRYRLSWRPLLHVVLQARAQAMAEARGGASTEIVERSFRPEAFRTLLGQLRRWISSLEPRRLRKTVWGRYPDEHSYSERELSAKAAFVEETVRSWRPALLWDLGCNTGVYSEIALRAGAGLVVGFESDPDALEAAFARARQGMLAFIPLHGDMMNPSPRQGWAQQERDGLAERAEADSLLALAFVHHLAVARNVPLPELLTWLVGLARTGVVEFVEKSDPAVQKMLALRQDIFPDYDRETFESLLGARARIVRKSRITEAGRTLYAYER
jgi:ribosomal protein L11 methylase PrmA